MACTQWSNPPSTRRHCHCSPCALATVAKTRSLIISSKAKDKPDQATRRPGERTTLGPGCKLTPFWPGLPLPPPLPLPLASFLAFCVISLKTKTKNGRRTMVKRNPAHPTPRPLGTIHAVHASVLSNCCCLWQQRRRRRPHVPQRLINL